MPKDLDVFASVLNDSGYKISDYEINLEVFSDTNQLLHIIDVNTCQCLHVPIEANLLDWDFDKIAEMVVERLDEETTKDWPDYLK